MLIQEKNKIQKEAFFKLSYGLYLLCTCHDGRDNGCIINTVMQVTDQNPRILFAVNNANYTAEYLHIGDAVNISVLDKEAPFSLYEQFGYQSGREVDKFAQMETPRDANGIRYLPSNACATISAIIESSVPCGTHTVYFAVVSEAKLLSDKPSVTYDDYFRNVKPKPQLNETEQKKDAKSTYVCQICGYVYEGDELPPDFVCPWCKHGADAFEKVN